MKKLYSVEVQGKRKKWSFNFWSEDCMEDWKADDLKITQLFNTVPSWVVKMRLTTIWCWLQNHYIIPLE